MIDSLWVKENAHRVVLSGGLNVKNVGDAIAYFHPLAVDISSGVEVEKGLKDPYLMKAFVAQVRLFDQPDKH
jgi:phosphoribosylanthranilate isomerase